MFANTHETLASDEGGSIANNDHDISRLLEEHNNWTPDIETTALDHENAEGNVV